MASVLIKELLLVLLLCQASAKHQVTAQPLADVVAAAFEHTHDGWSSDEVLLRDDLNAAFLKRCRAELPSVLDVDFNWQLLTLRKADKLPGPVTKREHLQHDAYRHAAEIAARLVQDRHGVNTDRMICNPATRTAFDRIATKLAPGVSAYRLRKAAFGLRKTRRLRPELVGRVIDWRLRIETVALDRARQDPAAIPNGPGVYIFRDPGGYLYIGESGNLRQRLQDHLEANGKASLLSYLTAKHDPAEVEIELHIFDPKSRATESAYRRAYESELISTRRPRYNIRP